VFIFLMRDGTLISIFSGDADDIYAPVVERLRVRAPFARGASGWVLPPLVPPSLASASPP
jgi:hypothetical protein